MTLIRWRWQSAAGTPLLAEKRGRRVVATAFGKWLAERIASLSIDFPVVAFHQVVLSTAGVELALLAHDGEVPTSLLHRLHAQVERETTLAALQCDWIQQAPLWEEAPIVSWSGRRRRRGTDHRPSIVAERATMT
jgi:hypothetical protein